MKIIILLSVLLFSVTALTVQSSMAPKSPEVLSIQQKPTYWLLLYRKSNQEFLYFGKPGYQTESELVKTFKVKTGIPGEKPTPLPELLGREYWVITEKTAPLDPEIARTVGPYFLSLDIPITEEEPFGPVPYEECNGQCNWIIPGAFGLHGVAGDESRLSDDDTGSSGCIRHLDDDITFLYNLLQPDSEEIRYYIEDI